MSSLKDARDMALISHSQGLITDEEFLLLLEENTSRNPEFSYDAYDRFDLENMEDAGCKSEFRVEKRDIPLLAEALGLPDAFTCPQRSVADGIEGLCMVLKRTSFPCRYSDMIYRFGRPVPVLSMVTNQVVDYIYQAHGHRLTHWNNLLLNPAALQRYADAIARKGAPLENCFGFVDGTVRPICRPNENQSTVYNGHKRVHALKFQSVTIPNGLIANLYGPVGIKAGTCIYLLMFFHQIYHRVVLCTKFKYALKN